MVTFRYHFLHFLPFTTGFFDLKYICMGFILSEGKNAVWSCFGIILEQFVWITLTVPEIPRKIPAFLFKNSSSKYESQSPINTDDLTSVPFSFLSCVLLSSESCHVNNTTNGRAGINSRIFLLCCVPLSSGRQYLPDRQIIEGMGNRNPRQDPYLEIHDRVLLSGSCSWKSQARSRPKEEGQIHIIWILVLRGGSCP